MLSEKKIPKTFWPEVINWAAHVLNQSPTKAIKNQVPEEAWSGNGEIALEQTRDRTTYNIDDAENHESNSSVEEESTSSGEARRRAPLVWMEDYFTGDGLSERDDEAYFLMFAIMDPIRIKDTVENEKWKHAIDVEMEAIKRNDTWELVDLPEGSKKSRSEVDL
ncbi:UNVERIFIED_CONTAM: hypothetical protein Sangu_2716100 [Sesamum angustifolium]|uniref:Transposase n=1 Tax=Sesamum angustifolium TaxID=2727405 RepID=A0AAW2IXL3_9LAMI